ncbi:MAG: hypothetical protein B6229_07815 [Spirochaetaceae bacterium 4572_7]|nr:MAG: hypothetical protein B6229_07815 [Spirochaetaceae bacterium 4572_7]
MKMTKLVAAMLALVFILASCGNKDAADGGKNAIGKAITADEKAMANEKRPDFSSPQLEDKKLKVNGLSEEVVWYTSNPGIFGSTRAKQGGEVSIALQEFPQTFRTLGPNSNGWFRSYLGTNGGLVATNNETKEWMPQLATHWAFSADKKTVYFKLNENVKWNDGEKVTSEDYLFTIEMMRSKNIQAPWYNDYFTNTIVDVKAYGDYVISITGDVEGAPDILLSNLSISPRPKHFYNGVIEEDWVDKYQWIYEPTVGPYTMDSFTKGELVTFKKVDDWWGYCYDYNKYRYNIDQINIKIITGGRDIQKQYFFNGELDTYGLVIPKDWADSVEADPVKNGYIDRQYSFYEPLTDSIRVPDFDPKKAGEFFDKAGYTEIGDDGIRVDANGNRLSFEMIYTASFHSERLAVLKEEAKKAGLEILLNNMTEGGFSLLLDKKHEAFFIGMGTGSIPGYWQYYHSENAKEQTNNFTMVQNDELDNLITKFKAEGDIPKKAEISKEIQRLVHDLALVIPSYVVPYTRGASWKWLRYPSWLNQKYSDAFLEPLANIMSGYNGYNWVDGDIKKEVIQAKMKGESFEPRTYIDDTNK